MSRRSRTARRCAAATAILCVAAALVGASPAQTQPEVRSPAVVARHQVTLITGDLVEVHRLSNGDASATLRPGPDRQNVSYATRRIDDQLYVIPADAMPLIAAGKLDQELFNLTALVDNGYDDARSGSLPLIVQYAPEQAAATAAVPLGTSARFTLESINAQSLRESKSGASAFWATLAPADGSVSATAGSVRKIWLNRRANATLAESVPQVGAPQAWEAGFDGTGATVAVLDTGIDSTHPDLDGGKVVAEQNFSDDTDTADHVGHGTHVASTVAGEGVGAATARRGVAPGASLINAKVLNSAGSGTFDQIIEGLEWAAAQGADVANLSLGTNSASDGTNDPLIEAVNSISQSSGMLIVAAAGNLGNTESTISSPGWADEALTVGAVDKQDALAGFSSRGPRLGDFGIKPDISGPGVDIIAARAAGTEIGPIVDGNYQTLSGTSMATPHVAGAAAILAQRFPNHTNRQIKDTLISTAKTAKDQNIYEQGGGRLDVARGYSQQVYASPGTLNLGFFSFPHTGQQPATRTVTYTNDTEAELTLDLSLEMSGKDSGAAPEGMFTVSASSVTVPAKGTAEVSVTVNPNAGPLDRFGGHLVATGGEDKDVVVHTSVGSYVEPEMYDVTVAGIARDGRPAAVISWAELWSLRNGQFLSKSYTQDSNSVTFRVAPGTYNLAGYLATADAASTFALDVAAVTQPQLEVTGDTSITLDARTANPITLSTPQPAAPATFTLSYHRGMDERNFHSSFTLSPPIARGYATPTEPVTKGDFEFYSKWDLVAPPLALKVVAPQDIRLDPQPMTNAVPVDGTHTLPLVHVGLGKPEDYEGKDVQGKIALISRGELTFATKIANATAAGAWGALIFNNRPGLLLAGAGNPGEVSIRGFTIDQEPGLALVDLLSRGPVEVEAAGTAVSPYFYDLLLPEPQRIPESLNYTVNQQNTAEIETRYDADVAVLGGDVRHISRPWPTFSVGFVRNVARPFSRTYLVSAGDTQWWHIAWSNAPFDGEFDHAYTSYEAGARLSEHWFGRVSRPGATNLVSTQVTRTADELTAVLFPYFDSDGHYGWNSTGDEFTTRLSADGQVLKETNTFPNGTFPAVAEPATYRLELNAKRATAWSTYATETDTTWTFQSSQPSEDQTERPALLQVDYDLELDKLNLAPAGNDYTFTLTAGHVPGVQDAPELSTVEAWASFDDGGTWQAISLAPTGNGSLRATVRHPALDGTSGAVSLRVKAADDGGNSIEQTVIRAYGLKPAI